MDMDLLRIAVALCLLGGVGAAEPARPRIIFTGNLNISSAELLNAIDDPFEANGTLQQELFERDLLLLVAHYWDLGYARVRVGEPKISATQIVIPIVENEVFTIGSVVVTGDPTPRMRARHRDAVSTRPSMLFSRTRISNDRERISRYYEERGYYSIDVRPMTKTDIPKRTIALDFQIELGKVTYVEGVNLDCPKVPDAAKAITVFAGDRYDVRTFEASKAAIMALGSLGKDDVMMWAKHGATDERVILGFECR